MNSATRTYVRQLGLSMLAYAVVLVASLLLLRGSPAPVLAVSIALAPVVPVAFGLAAIVRFLGQLDELQRRIHLEAVTLSAVVTSMLTFSYGLLENAGFPSLGLVWVLPLMVTSWGLASAIVSRKFR
jgi:hypothetical protein